VRFLCKPLAIQKQRCATCVQNLAKTDQSQEKTNVKSLIINVLTLYKLTHILPPEASAANVGRSAGGIFAKMNTMELDRIGQGAPFGMGDEVVHGHQAHGGADFERCRAKVG